MKNAAVFFSMVLLTSAYSLCGGEAADVPQPSSVPEAAVPVVITGDERAQRVVERYLSVLENSKSITFTANGKLVKSDYFSMHPKYADSHLRFVVEYGQGPDGFPFHRMSADLIRDGKIAHRFAHDGKITTIIDHLEGKFVRTSVDTELLLAKLGVSASMNARCLAIPENFYARSIRRPEFEGAWEFIGTEMTGDVLCDVVRLVEIRPMAKPSSLTMACAREDGFPRRIEMESEVVFGAQEKYPFHAIHLLTSVHIDGMMNDTLFSVEVPGNYVEVQGKKPKHLIKVGDKAPEFLLKDHLNREVSLASLKGKIVLLNFWATWCGPCKRAMPALKKIGEDFGEKDVVLLGINTFEHDGGASAVEFLVKNKEFPRSLLNGDELSKTYGIKQIPTVVIIGRDGKVALIGSPGEPLRSTIEKALSAPMSP